MPGSRHPAAKSTQRLLLARRVNFLVVKKLTTPPEGHTTVRNTSGEVQVQASHLETLLSAHCDSRIDNLPFSFEQEAQLSRGRS